MESSIQATLKALVDADVKYLIVGGVAVVLHGHLRTTMDLDLVLQLESGNLLRALRALSELGFQARAPVSLEAFADQANRESWVRSKNMVVFSLWHPENHGFAIDLFIEEPFDFDEVYQRAVVVSLPSTNAHVIALDDLIAMKETAGRAKDTQDIEALREIQKNRRRNP